MQIKVGREVSPHPVENALQNAVDPFVWTGFSVFKWERLFS
jgi:hypothetical protein